MNMNETNKRIIVLFCLSFSIGLADFVTTLYGLSLNIGLVEGDGLYIPFLSTLVLFCLGYSCLYFSYKLKSRLFNITSILCISSFTVFLSIPIINNVSLIV